MIQLFGQIPRPLRSSQLNVAWIISHPDLVTDELLCSNDLVFAASDRLAALFASRSGRPVTPLYRRPIPTASTRAPTDPSTTCCSLRDFALRDGPSSTS